MEVEHEGSSTPQTSGGQSSQLPLEKESPPPVLSATSGVSAARLSSSSGSVWESTGEKGHQATSFASPAIPPNNPLSTQVRPSRVFSESSEPLFEPDELPRPADESVDYEAGAKEILSTSPEYFSLEHPTFVAVVEQLSPSIILPHSAAQDSQTLSDLPVSSTCSDTVVSSGIRSKELQVSSLQLSLFNSAIVPEKQTFEGLSVETSTPLTAHSHGMSSEPPTPGSPPLPSQTSPAPSPAQLHDISEPHRSPSLKVASTGPSQSTSTSPVALSLPRRDTTGRYSFRESEHQKRRNQPALLGGPSSSSRGNTTEEKKAAENDLSSLETSSKNCDVYIGLFGTDLLLARYAKWMHAELESHGTSCFIADRSLYSEQRSHDIALSVLHSVTFGVVLITKKAFRNPYTIEEISIFLDRGNLVPVFFDVAPPDCLMRDIVEKRGEIWEVDGGELWSVYKGGEKSWSDAVEGLLTVEDRRVEANWRNWRESIRQVGRLVGSSLGRHSAADIEDQREAHEELPWPRNAYFAGREKELKVVDKMLFSGGNATTVDSSGTVAQTLARRSDDSSKAETEDLEATRLSNYGESHEEIVVWPYQSSGQFSGLCRDPFQTQSQLERGREGFSGNLKEHSGSRRGTWGRSSREQKRRDSNDRRGENDKFRFSHYCVVTGAPGIGKSELALEYAYRNAQKFEMVLWVNGESRYLRQNYLNLSSVLGVDVGSTENQSQTGNTTGRGRVMTFDEREAEAVQTIRHKLQTDIPYLLIIDNLDAERDPLDGRDLTELLPRPGSATHVIITTRLPRVMHFDISLELPHLSSFEALTLMRDGKWEERSFSVQQIDKFKEFEDKLGRLPFGLAIVGRLINEFDMKPSEILAKMGTVETKKSSFTSNSMGRDDMVLRSNTFLVKLLDVCFNLMAGGTGAKSLAVRMAYVGGWFGPSPCPLWLLALAANKLEKELGGRTNFFISMLSCWMSTSNGRSEADARDLLTRLGLARASARDDSLYFPDIIQVRRPYPLLRRCLVSECII